jgi:hypothetical protein
MGSSGEVAGRAIEEDLEEGGGHVIHAPGAAAAGKKVQRRRSVCLQGLLQDMMQYHEQGVAASL